MVLYNKKNENVTVMYSPLILILIFVIAFFTLARSSAVLIRGLTLFGRVLRLSEFAISFLLMSFATSVSELFVGISSAAGGISELSLGNIFGANLLNITIVIAIPILIAREKIEIESKIRRRNFWFIFFLSLFPFLLGLDGVISRGDGVILLILFVFYIMLIAGENEYFSKVYKPAQFHEGIFKRGYQALIFLGYGFLFLIISSAVLVWASKELSLLWAIGTLSFGVLFVSLGTTLPELIFGVRAALSEHGAMTIGNAIGSIAFNSAFIVGIVSIIQPITIRSPLEFFFVLGAFIAAFLFFNYFIYQRNTITKKEALIMISIYLIFVSFEFLCKSCLVF
ncbi:MAG: sodium:calcium antiporter [Candidatus Niyogibacteria bacterium]|nr:sodium:calcium antiporter [Candidatus Niyogibacteria bacterium]